MKLHRNAVWLLPLALIVTFPLWRIPLGNFLTPRGGIDPILRAPKSTTNTQSFNMDKVKILQNQDGIDTALILAESAHTGDNTDILLLNIVSADLYGTNGNVTHIVSKTGRYDVATKLLTLIDDVVVTKTQDKQTLYTDLLYYDNEKRTVKCPGKTKLIGENVTIDGGSLNYDIKTAKYDIGNGVYVVLEGFTPVSDNEAP